MNQTRSPRIASTPARAPRALVVVVSSAVLLAACATPPPPAPKPQTVESPSIQPRQEFPFQHDLQQALRDALQRTGQGPIHTFERSDGMPAVRIDGSAFQGQSGELQAAALLPLGNVGRVLANAGPCVIHILGESADVDAPAGADLGERRASAIASALSSLGVPQARIRATSRIQPGAVGGVDIIVNPIVFGHEAEAWVPPPAED